ncbi:hypothetical protein AVEN_249499-1, partial [Araneus ventricosus]
FSFHFQPAHCSQESQMNFRKGCIRRLAEDLSSGGFSLVHLDDGVLVNILENMRGVQKYTHGSSSGDQEEDV